MDILFTNIYTLENCVNCRVVCKCIMHNFHQLWKRWWSINVVDLSCAGKCPVHHSFSHRWNHIKMYASNIAPLRSIKEITNSILECCLYRMGTIQEKKTVKKSMGFRMCELWPWASCLIFLGFSFCFFSFYKMGILMVPAS